MTATSTPSTAARFVGQSVTRKEDARLLTGHGEYVDDTTMPRHAARGIRAERDRGVPRSRASTPRAAKAAPGVVAVFTWQDFDGNIGEAWHAMLGPDMTLPPPLAIGDVRYVGDTVAIVVAESRAVAEDACELVEVDYEPGQAVVDFATAAADTEQPRARARGGSSPTPWWRRRSCRSPAISTRRSRPPPMSSSALIEQNRYICVPMETRGIVASWTPGRDEMEIVCATQSVHETRNFFARYLDIPEGSITVTAHDVGGGFGQKMFVFREECAVVLAARLLGRPVKWIEDRRENLLSAPHSRNELGKVRMAVDDDGIIQAITVEHKGDIGAYPACPGGDGRPALLPGPYKIPRLGYSMSMVWTNTMGKGAYRGPWMFETTAREMAIDYAAREIGLDPAEFRRKNLLAAADLPHTSPSGDVFTEITPLETLEQALEMLDYEAFRKEQAEARAEGRCSASGSVCTWSPRRWVAPRCTPRARPFASSRAARSWRSSAPRRTGRAWRPRWRRSSPTRSASAYDDVTVVQADTQSTPVRTGHRRQPHRGDRRRRRA